MQVYLGHADIATTPKYYVHLFGDDLPERRSVLDAEPTRSLLEGSAVDADQDPRDSVRPIDAEVQRGKR